MILLVGGAGFIGSYVNQRLTQLGHNTVILDNLSAGNRNAITSGHFIQGEMADSGLLDKIFEEFPIEAVMHFAALIDVGESINSPGLYYKNNVADTLCLLLALQKHRIPHLIFSSTAAIFGNPITLPVPEEHPKNPINPYGRSKWMVEWMLQDFDKACGLKYVALRYFNAAGGDPEGIIKNYKLKETNLIPLALRSLKDPSATLTLFGRDYPTPDGTCIRDYIHVHDIAEAHILALQKLQSGASSAVYNLGNGKGFSVQDVLTAIDKVTGKRLRIIEGKRREGDAPQLVADSKKARKELGWQCRFPSLDTMIQHAWIALN